MDYLEQTVRDSMSRYARKGLNSQSYLTHSNDNMILTVVTVPKKPNPPFISILVRLDIDLVIVERDQNDKPLVDALVQAGIPRSQIILAYAGEPVPEIT